MKTLTMISTIVLGLAVQALAGPDDNNNNPSASTTTPSKNIVQKRISQYVEGNNAVNYKIERVGNVSSRPWGATAGFSGGSPTPFAGDRERYYEPHFNVFWVGARPN
jgi:hypothetical protein